jgi:succinoglycan biosynthesis protein ExoV
MFLQFDNDTNFGDALNPILFKHLLPEFFDEDKEEYFLGIGSVFGISPFDEKAKKIHVFSSGFAYGEPPKIDDRYNILCVRGPITAKTLNLDPKLAVADGALLISELYKAKEKKYNYSFMPHCLSDKKNTKWKLICDKLGINYISPTINSTNSVEKICYELSSTEILITEALHGAIIAQAFNVPWIPIQIYNHINLIKWEDFALSLDLKFSANQIGKTFSNDFLYKKFVQKTKLSPPKFAFDLIADTTKYLIWNEDKLVSKLENLMKQQPVINAKEDLVNLRKEQLLEILYKFRKDYA